MNTEDKERVSIYKQVSELESKALKNSKNRSFDSDVFEILSLGVCFINPPVGILLGLSSAILGGFETSKKSKTSLEETRMPDSWLKDVSNSDIISDESLSFLAKRLKKKGFISVADALQFIDLENEICRKKSAQKEKEKLLENEGALAILKKAEFKFPNEFKDSVKDFSSKMTTEFLSESIDSIQNTLEKTTKVLNLTSNGLSFIKEKVIKKDQ